MVTGFDALPAVAGAYQLEVDGNNRLYVSSGATIKYIEEGGTAFMDANPATDGIITGPIVGFTRGPDGAIWAAPTSSNKLMKRAKGGTAWTVANTGIATGGGLSPPGFDAAGNAYVMLNSAGALAAQMYKLPAGTTTWASFGPMFTKQSSVRPVIIADGTVYVTESIAGTIQSLDAAGTAYTVVTNMESGQLVLGKDGSVFGLSGIGSGTKAIVKGPAVSVFTTEQAFGMSGNGVTDPGGICGMTSGDVYATTTPLNSTVSGLWRRNSATSSWTQLALTPNPTGQAYGLACAPNGRLYSNWAHTIYRSK